MYFILGFIIGLLFTLFMGFRIYERWKLFDPDMILIAESSWKSFYKAVTNKSW